MTARAVPSPRLLQPYSPRRPSPLGLPPLGFPPQPPLAPHVAFQSPAYPKTPDRSIQPKGPSENRVAFPPDARRPLAGAQRRRSHSNLPPLNLNDQQHPPTQQQYPATAQPALKQDMTMTLSPPSPTPSDTSSLSLYSADSAKKRFSMDVGNEERQMQDGENEKPPGVFCCFNFKSWFGSKAKAKEARILGPPAAAAPAPQAQMVQVPRRRPSPLNL